MNNDKQTELNCIKDKVNTTDTNSESSPEILSFYSMTLYIIAIILPGCNVGPGWWMLILGLLGGWMYSPAPYANLFYFYAFAKKRNKEKPYISTIIMLLLTSTIVFFSGIPRTAICGATPLVYWGWGAVAWVMAIISLALAVFFREKDSKQQKIIFYILLSVTILPVCLYRTVQYFQANSQEREEYLPLSAAFATHKFSGIPYIEPPKLSITNDSVIELVGTVENGRLVDGDFVNPYLPDTYQYNGKIVHKYRSNRDFITVAGSSKPVDYYYGIKQTSSKRGEMFILDHNKQPIWQAPIILTEKGRKYPDYDSQLKYKQFKVFSNVAVEPKGDGYAVKGKVIKKESATSHCTIEIIAGEKDQASRFKFNHQLIETDKEFNEPQKTAFCSDSYIFVFMMDNKKNEPFDVIAFDKDTMLPMKDFHFDTREQGETFEQFWENYKQTDNLDFIKSVTLEPEAPTSKSHTNKRESVKVTISMINDEMTSSPYGVYY